MNIQQENIDKTFNLAQSKPKCRRYYIIIWSWESSYHESYKGCLHGLEKLITILHPYRVFQNWQMFTFVPAMIQRKLMW